MNVNPLHGSASLEYPFAMLHVAWFQCLEGLRLFRVVTEWWADVFKKILTLCVGNICRSPTAEYLLRQRLAGRDIQVASAGLRALAGHPVEGCAMAILKERGIDASAHRARQIDAVMLREADLVLGMERRHLAAAARLAPEASGKLFLLGKWNDFDGVPDPYRQSRQVFESVYGLIERGVDSWLRYL
jgi:protein-tyrosine phosphatase